MRVLNVFEATFGPPNRTAAQKEIMIQVWSETLGEFDNQTLYDAAKWCTENVKQWPKPADMLERCRLERSHLAAMADTKPKRPQFPQPPECPIAVEARRRDAELRRLQKKLMDEAGEPPIDWSKNHAAEFARVEPFRDRARKELGYVE